MIATIFEQKTAAQAAQKDATYIHVHFYMHCYSMYGLWIKEGGNDGVSIAWKLFMLQQEAIYIAINHA